MDRLRLPTYGWLTLFISTRASSLAIGGLSVAAIMLTIVLILSPFTHPQSPVLTVQYMPDTSAAPTTTIRAQMQITDTGGNIALNQLTLRYWFIAATTQPVHVYCDAASIGCASITARVVAMSYPTANADNYIQIGFTGGMLTANKNTITLMLHVTKDDAGSFAQIHDYSYNGTFTHLTNWQRITLYLRDTLVWGTEPGGNPIAATAVDRATAIPTVADVATVLPSPISTNTLPTSSTPDPTRPAVSTPTGTIINNVYITFYGFPDNSCQNESQHTCNTIAYQQQDGFPTKHNYATEGMGTYSDPITYAGADDNLGNGGPLRPGTIIYVPYLKKYFVLEDQCYECNIDWKQNRYWHVDLWMGSNIVNGGSTIIACENHLTVDSHAPGTGQIIVNPPTNLPVDTTKLFTNGSANNSGTCTAHLYSYH